MSEQHHFRDPCIHCGTPHDEVEVGPCKGGPSKAVPIAYCINEKRWDGYESYLIRMSTGEVVERWCHPSEHAPYYHFGYSDELQKPLRYDLKIARKP